jgi:heme A synthase
VASEANLVRAPGQYLRRHRMRLSLWIALGEAFLVLIHVIPRIALYLLAVLALILWFAAARRYSNNTARNASWVFATSQSVAVLVPILWEVTKFFVAVAVVVAIAVAALVFLFTERDRPDPGEAEPS